MNIAIKRDINSTYLIIEKQLPYVPDYQIHMLRANQLKGLLPISGRGVDEYSQYHYEISGKVSVKAMYEKAKMEYEDMRRFMHQLLEVMQRLCAYMLDVNKLILEPEYIFYAEEQFYFCYCPVQEVPLCQVFHELTEYFVSQTDYNDKEGILLAYELHKASMEDNYNIAQINERIANQIQKQVKDKPPCEAAVNIIKEPGQYEQFYSTDDWEEEKKAESEEDWIETVSQGVKSIREKAEGFKPVQSVKEMLKNRKKFKWGDWGDL